ncbi:MAG TPA: deoxyribonuclease IV [Anaerolineae bacterium]|nr:deoxyribonuclease IV [Anaerolineae bacterium]
MTGPRLGAHMSIAGGPANALLQGQSIGCDAVQIFTRNANRWRSKELTSEQIKDFEQARSATGIHPIVAHSSYLINLATPDDDLWRRSVEALILEMRRCQQLGVRDYVLHPGARKGSGEKAGLERIVTALSAALSATHGSGVAILLENTAGQGSSLGYTFEHLAWLMGHTEGAYRLGMCFDTAHALAAGYEFRQAESYARMWDQFDDLIGIEQLRAIHLNDSKRDLGSRVDRHEHMGKGYVGLEAFDMLVNDPRLRSVPMLLETPKGPDMAEDVENLALLRGLIHD